ncbi:MAG: FAD synthetase family protein [Sphaerochaetaceae bacterium]|nr:FAD synthetase family protein [Sphaerochaetaceae bacterium]
MESRAFADPMFRDMPCAICIGVFDGFHLGHQSIIDQTIELARQLDCKSVVMTFSKNPKMASGVMKALPALQTVQDFEEMLANRGVDYHCVIDFSDNISKLAGEEFITLLCTSYKVRAMVVGDSFRCGRPPLSVGPQQIEKLLKYTSSALLKVMPSVFIDEDEDSSSLIRRCLLTGDLEKASRLLGRAYSLDLRGKAFASSENRLLFDVRTLGLLLPPAGKYKVRATVCGQEIDSLACVSEDYLALELPVRMKPDRITFLGE